MNQKLSDWASVAEIVASVAIVVTLIILIVGVRENTNIVRASAYSNNLQSMIDLQASILSDPDAVRAYTYLDNGDFSRIDDQDRTRLVLIIFNHFRAFEGAYFSERYGLLGEAEWRRVERNICFFFFRAQSAGLGDRVRVAVTQEFMLHVENLCLE